MIPGYRADFSLFQSDFSYYSAKSAGQSSNTVVPQGWCEWKCQLTYFACAAGCVGTGPAAPLCAAACLVKNADCFDKCGSNPPPCVNPRSCNSMFDCCQDHFCISSRCVHCNKSRTGRCSGPGSTPCCTGYHCCGNGCYPRSMQCP